MKITEIYEAAKQLNCSKYFSDRICEIIKRHHLEDSWQDLKPYEMAEYGFGPLDCSIIRQAQMIFKNKANFWGEYYGKHYPIT